MPIQIIEKDEKLTYEIEGSKISYRRITTLKRGAIVKRHTKRGKADWNAITEEILRYIITGWENVEKAGLEIPFDPDLITAIPEDVLTEILELAGAPSHECCDDRPPPNQFVVRRQTRTSSNITGTSINTPTTVASAAPDANPNNMTDVAMATSK